MTTRNLRAAALSFGLAWSIALPLADGAISVDDGRQLLASLPLHADAGPQSIDLVDAVGRVPSIADVVGLAPELSGPNGLVSALEVGHSLQPALSDLLVRHPSFTVTAIFSAALEVS